MAGRMIIVAEATANTGHEDAVRAALRTCSAPSRDEPGNVLYQPLECEAPGTFLVYEIWQDKDAFEFHRETPHFKTLVDTIGPLCGAISIRVMEPLEV